MRYFRYKNTDKNREMAWKAQYKAVTKNQKRIIRKARCWESISSIATVLIFVSCLVGGSFLLESKMPQPDGWFLKLLVGLCKLALGMVLVVASGGVTVALTMPLWKKGEFFSLPAMKQEILQRLASACGAIMGCGSLTSSPNALMPRTRSSGTMMCVCLLLGRNCG